MSGVHLNQLLSAIADELDETFFFSLRPSNCFLLLPAMDDGPDTDEDSKKDMSIIATPSSQSNGGCPSGESCRSIERGRERGMLRRKSITKPAVGLRAGMSRRSLRHTNTLLCGPRSSAGTGSVGVGEEGGESRMERLRRELSVDSGGRRSREVGDSFPAGSGSSA